MMPRVAITVSIVLRVETLNAWSDRLFFAAACWGNRNKVRGHRSMAWPGARVPGGKDVPLSALPGQAMS